MHESEFCKGQAKAFTQSCLAKVGSMCGVFAPELQMEGKHCKQGDMIKLDLDHVLR